MFISILCITQKAYNYSNNFNILLCMGNANIDILWNSQVPIYIGTIPMLPINYMVNTFLKYTKKTIDFIEN